MSRLRTLGYLIASAVMIVTASRVPALCWLALIALVPGLIALHGRALRAWAGGGAFIFFLVAFGAYYWIYDVTTHFGGLHPALAGLAVFLFALMNLWQGAIGFLLFRWLAPRLRLPPALLFALCFTCAWHYIPALFFWDYSLLVLRWSWLIQGIDAIGTFGLDLILCITNYALYQAWMARRMVPATWTAAGLLILMVSYGATRVPWLQRQLETAPRVRVALIQPNLDSAAKADPANLRAAIDTMSALSARAAEAQPDLIIWPEAVVSIDYTRDRGLQEFLARSTTAWQSWLLFGGNQFELRTDGGWRAFNSAFLIGPGDTTPQRYSKNQLLAFGEYIPLEDRLPILRRWFPDRVGQFGRGAGPTIFTFRTRHGVPVPFAPVICYESIISEYMRRNAALPIDFIAELTNDGWYGRTMALDYHKDLTILRAIENRIGILRTTNTGITTVIDPLGREHHTLPLETAASAVMAIPQIRPAAIFTSWGHGLKPLAGGLLVILCGLGLLRWRQARDITI